MHNNGDHHVINYLKWLDELRYFIAKEWIVEILHAQDGMDPSCRSSKISYNSSVINQKQKQPTVFYDYWTHFEVKKTTKQ